MIQKILNPTQLAASTILSATTFETVLLLNNGSSFSIKPLPIQAQFAPVLAAIPFDANQDGNADIILGGNLAGTRVRTGRFSGNYVFLFSGDGKGNFSYETQKTSGFSVRGDVRKIIRQSNHIFFAINNGPVRAYTNTNQ